MPENPRWKSLSIPTGLYDEVFKILKHNYLGYETMSAYVGAAIREKNERSYAAIKARMVR